MLRPKPRQATYADIEALPPNMVGEIIYGVLNAQPRPVYQHSILAWELAGEMRDPFSRGRGGPGGWIFGVEAELHLGPHVVVPDISGWRKERLTPRPKTAYISIAPDWLCELLSPSTQRLDRTDKLAIYAEYGVQHCWYIDPAARTLEVLALTQGKWLLTATFKNDDPVTAPPFEAHTFPLNVLWVGEDD